MRTLIVTDPPQSVEGWLARCGALSPDRFDKTAADLVDAIDWPA